MNYIDIALGIFLAIGVFQGFRRGFLVELASLAGLLLGIYGAIYFSHYAAAFIHKYTSWGEDTVELVAFITTFLVVLILVSMLAKALTKVAGFVALGMLNKLLGALFGLLKTALFASILLLILNSFDRQFSFLTAEKKEASILYKPVESVAPMVLPKLFKELNRYISEDEM